MKAYKIWHDEPHYIHKDTTNELNVKWTTDITQAKDLPTFKEIVDFFFNKLGFNINSSTYNALYLLETEK
mgnify:CR=1 FL=1